MQESESTVGKFRVRSDDEAEEGSKECAPYRPVREEYEKVDERLCARGIEEYANERDNHDQSQVLLRIGLFLRTKLVLLLV